MRCERRGSGCPGRTAHRCREGGTALASGCCGAGHPRGPAEHSSPKPPATPGDVGHQAAIEEQIAVTLSVLHHQHAEEDRWLWPTLRKRAPAAPPELDRLEAQHTQLHPLIASAGDTSRPLPMRATVLAELQRAINAHLDEEERAIRHRLYSQPVKAAVEALGLGQSRTPR